jgi:hypothetical protein
MPSCSDLTTIRGYDADFYIRVDEAKFLPMNCAGSSNPNIRQKPKITNISNKAILLKSKAQFGGHAKSFYSVQFLNTS